VPIAADESQGSLHRSIMTVVEALSARKRQGLWTVVVGASLGLLGLAVGILFGFADVAAAVALLGMAASYVVMILGFFRLATLPRCPACRRRLFRLIGHVRPLRFHRTERVCPFCRVSLESLEFIV
jgi:uncharacterized MnhB-related membrane protein